MVNIFSKLLDINQREIDRLSKTVLMVNSHTASVEKLKDKDFARKTEEFKKRLAEGETLEDILPEAFALAREASWRAIGLKPYDVQIMAAIALFQGKVVEQKTGEGKTLSAVPALYLRSLEGKGAHLVTVNDYLARRDAGWNGPTFKLLGLSVGAIVQEMKSYVYDEEFKDTSHGDERLAHLKESQRREAYATDVTYGTNNEFGFDYLRDNMVMSLDQMSQRGHYFAIVDEVDSVLIDEARTPLIISAPDMEPTSKYFKFAELVDKLNSDVDYTIDEKSKSASLTEHGITKVEKILGVENLYEKDFDTIHHIENALRARTLYLKDRDYIVKDDQVVIVDEFTGRLMVGRRWSDGLHQAVEAEEKVQIQQESKTLATISFQNYFRMYDHLAGMTGTAATEAEEFKKIYGLDVVVVPTHRDMVRKDQQDVIYKTLRAKYGSVVADIEKRYEKGQPVLVGTTSIEKNDIIANYLKRKRIPHNVLNAKNHEREAMIISDAGKPGTVTVATNMAGRGVDIVLGGSVPDKADGVSKEKFRKSKEYKKWESDHERVIKSGGLYVIGTERHESRRIDNQLRGRSGRQGDPGESKFYLSLEDDLMRIFGGEQISGLMDRLKLPEDQPIENKLISRAIEQAQVKVETFHFDARKSLVEYDDVKNQQREIVYKLRQRVLTQENFKKEILEKLIHQVDKILVLSWPSDGEKLDLEKVVINFMEIVPFDDASRDRVREQLTSGKKEQDEVKNFLVGVIKDVYGAREKDLGERVMREVEKFSYLGAIDRMWIDHIDNIDGIEQAVRLRGYAQRDPVAEFKNEAYDLFEGLLDRIDDELARRLFRVGVATQSTGSETLQGLRPEIPIEAARTNEDMLDKTGLIPEDSDLVAAAGEPAFTKAMVDKPSFVANQELAESQAKQSPYAPITQKTQDDVKKQKIGRNDPCWCGSGKKWKKCHYPQPPTN